jgi:hypothetical protein
MNLDIQFRTVARVLQTRSLQIERQYFHVIATLLKLPTGDHNRSAIDRGGRHRNE